MGNLRQKYTDEEWNNLESDINKRINESKKQGGFFDLPVDLTCRDNNHLPPTHLHIPQGKGYKHICPTCNKETILIPPQISF